jgi:1-deoxy-D-xylulose-5-phosphate synthase
VYSTFLNRAFDQVLMDVALHRLPVTFALDRAGVTGVDGPSHHGVWDVAMLGQIPGMRVAAPRDAAQLRLLLGEAMADRRGPNAVRYPTGVVPLDIPESGCIGSASLLTPRQLGGDVMLVPVGPLAGAALDAAHLLERDGVPCVVADPRWILPVDPALGHAAADYRLVVTIEDGAAPGGFGDAFARCLRTLGPAVPLLTITLPDGFVEPYGRSEAHRRHGLDGNGISSRVTAALKQTDYRPSRRRRRTA